MYIDLLTAKRHLNIDSSFTDDDQYITDLIIVAEAVIEKHINDDLSELVSFNGDVLPSPLKQAMLLYIGHLYANREIATFSNVNKLPYTFDYLLSFYKNYEK